jgi:hypothetical protein
LRDWLRLLGFEVESARFGCYRPAFDSPRWMERCAWMDTAGARWWPIFGGVFMVSAVKHHPGMRLVGRVAQKRPQSLRQLNPVVERKIQPTAPHNQHDRHEPA